MIETSHKEDGTKVYEIGYLLVPSIPPEKVLETVANLKDILSKREAIIIAEESPELRELAYDMTKKIGTINHRFEQGYFGWLKFELSTDRIETVKKEFEMHPDMLRMLLIITVRENTYLGKKLPVVSESPDTAEGIATESPTTETLPIAGLEEKAVVTPTSIEEMDKSIDEMVKEA